MAVNSRYIQYYTPGSAAEKLQPAHIRQEQQAKRVRRSRKKVIYIDPVAILGGITAVVLMITMFVGLAAYNASCEEYTQMAAYTRSLQRENERLVQQYQDGYDLEEVRLDAVLLGYVPEEQVLHVTLDVPQPPVQEHEPTFWEILASVFA